MKNKKRNKVFLLLILLLGISIGFAALATTLKINGTSTITKNTWSVYWSNIGNKSGVTPSVEPTISSEDQDHPNNIVSFEVTLDKPGDFYEFQVDATNAGTIDAMLDVISTNITSDGSPATLPSYINYTVTYADDVEPVQKHLLPKKTGSNPATERYKVRIEFLRTITNEELNNMPEEGLEYDIELGIPYIQADDTAIDRHAVSYTYYYYDITNNAQQTTTDRSVITRNEYVRTATGISPELCMVRPNQDLCFSANDYDWACDGGCTFDPNGAKTQALLARFTAAGVTGGTSSSNVYFGDSQTQYCDGNSYGGLNCFTTVDYNPEGRYCYCSVNTQSPSDDYCGCYN